MVSRRNSKISKVSKAGKTSRTSKWKNIFADIFELPHEVTLEVPRLIMVSNKNLLLENHRGIIEYTEELVRIAVSNGEIMVKGQDLRLKTLASEDISIAGVIESLEYED